MSDTSRTAPPRADSLHADSLPLLAITLGDPAGIGPEIVVKALAQLCCSGAVHLPVLPCVVGDIRVLERACQLILNHTPHTLSPAAVDALQRLRWQPVHSWAQARAVAAAHTTAGGGGAGCGGTVAVMAPQALPAAVLSASTPQAQQAPAGSEPHALPVFGQVQASAGHMAAASIYTAAQAALRGDCDAIVTAPIHKEALALAGLPWPGHTEMLQALAAAHTGVPVADMPVRMMLANTELKTVLNSIHVSLRHAIDAVTPEQVWQTIAITHDFLNRVSGHHHCSTSTDSPIPHRPPSIAVAGLNPHAGESGLFGREEIDAIAPAIARARAQGWNVHGPWPPDTVFMQARQQHASQPPFCDAVIAMYHDQGLIPVKYLGVEHGVNVTLGLPLIRTSPDHGTAFDLAGTGRASEASMLAALRMACQLLG